MSRGNWECMAGLCILQIPPSRCMGELDAVSSWRYPARMFLKLTAENCGTVIPQWNYTARATMVYRKTSINKGKSLARTCGDCARALARPPTRTEWGQEWPNDAPP